MRWNPREVLLLRSRQGPSAAPPRSYRGTSPIVPKDQHKWLGLMHTSFNVEETRSHLRREICPSFVLVISSMLCGNASVSMLRINSLPRRMWRTRLGTGLFRTGDSSRINHRLARTLQSRSVSLEGALFFIKPNAACSFISDVLAVTKSTTLYSKTSLSQVMHCEHKI
jgi:hypothetical protein